MQKYQIYSLSRFESFGHTLLYKSKLLGINFILVWQKMTQILSGNLGKRFITRIKLIFLRSLRDVLLAKPLQIA